MNPTQNPAWKALADAAKNTPKLRELVQDSQRNKMLTFELGGCLFDFSKQRVDQNILLNLQELAHACGLESLRDDMLAGASINLSEDRAVLHAALRQGAKATPEISHDIANAQAAMHKLALKISTGQWRGCTNLPITDVVHIGIGGSHLGPELVVDALHEYRSTHLNIHFLVNIDANDLNQTLKGLNPETTLFIVASKSFSTLETKVNATSARSWFLERTNNLAGLAKHFVGVTSNIEAAVEFGLDADNLLPMWDWVGGRFSLWSTVGLPILLSLGPQHYQQFLQGAQEVDDHFSSAPLAANVPAISALVGLWNYNFCGASNLAVLSYDQRLKLLPDFLQQLEMESNGKSVTREGEKINYHTMGVLWGGVGTNGQHAYHQLLHQGTREFAADFIVVKADSQRNSTHHQWLTANALAQSQAMAVGFDADPSEPHRQVRGNHPSTTIVLDELGPRQLGALLAVYEHKVFCQGVLWQINSFDQWGVELGKNLSLPIHAQLSGQDSNQSSSSNQQDAATQSLINHLLKN